MGEQGRRIWEPKSQEQSDFLALPFSIFEGLFGGANGGGKTEIEIAYPLAKGFHNDPNFHGVFFRKTNKQLRESIEPRAERMYKQYVPGTQYNHTDMLFRFPSGARMRLSYMENLQEAWDHDTNEYNLAIFEELTQFQWEPYAHIAFSRVRTSTNLPAIVRSGATPGNIGHKWVQDRFIRPAKHGYTKLGQRILDPISKEERMIYRMFIPALGMSNPELVKNDPDYFIRLGLMSEADQRAKIWGDWDAFIGQVFKEFRERRFPGEPEQAIHVIQEKDWFEIPSWWPKIIAIDWGFAHPTFVLWAAIDDLGRVWVYREYTCKETKISEWAADVQRMSQFDENIVDIVIDPSAQQNRGQQQTIYEQFMDVTGWFQTRLADNDRIGGKQLLHEFLRWKPRPKKFIPAEGFDFDKAMYILRNNGDEAYNRYMSYFRAEPNEEFIPKLKIFSRCKGLIEVLPQCSYDDRRPEDVKKFDGDDGYDCIRYLLKAVDLHLDPAKYEFARMREKAAIVSQFASVGESQESWSSLFRRMEALEARTTSQTSVLSRASRYDC